MENNKISSFQEAICPICGRFYFSKPLDEEDIKDYEEGELCTICGWIYDEGQLNNHDLVNGKNSKSVNQYKIMYQNKIEENKNYKYLDEIKSSNVKKHLCPICGIYMFKDLCSYDVCPICGWEDDGTEELLDGKEIEGVNGYYSEYLNSFTEKRKNNPEYFFDPVKSKKYLKKEK